MRRPSAPLTPPPPLAPPIPLSQRIRFYPPARLSPCPLLLPSPWKMRYGKHSSYYLRPEHCYPILITSFAGNQRRASPGKEKRARANQRTHR